WRIITQMTTRERVGQLVKAWPKVYPNAHCELDFRNPLQLLVATILSAQCTDKRVNMVTPALFKKYRTAKDYANAPQAELESAIKPTGFYRNKTKNIRGVMRASPIAQTARFSGYVRVAKFFCERARQRSRARLLNAPSQRFRQGRRGAKDSQHSRLVCACAEIVFRVSSVPRRINLRDRQVDCARL